MAKVKYFKPLGRTTRVEDDVSELGENTTDKLKEAIRQGNQELALELAEYRLLEGKGQHDAFTDMIFCQLDWIARNHGEEELPKVMRFLKTALDRNAYHSAKKSATPLERLIIFAEGMRAHPTGPNERGNFKVWEEADRYVMEMDPCGSGGRMARGPLNGSGSRLNPPYNLGTTTKPYPWSWGKANIPYYCIHCCVWNEVMAIEATGYPWKVTECPEGDSEEPCYWYFYKDPNLIPEEYFERVGFKKDPSKFTT